MKKFLVIFFFLLFISVIFMWDQELSTFWLDPNNRTFIITEVVRWMGQYPGVFDFLHTYRYPILLIGGAGFLASVLIKKRKKRRENEKNNIFTGKKVIFDANEILSKESLPESEKKREKKLKEGPPLIDKTKVEKPKVEKEPEPDLDPESMRRILNKE